jgi:aminopeptidase N
VDPEDAILKVVKFRLPEEMLIATLKEDTSCMARIRAAFALQDMPTRNSLEALSTALREDPFWGVQADVATVLGEMRGARALRALLEALPLVKHPKARRALVRALGNWQNADAATALIGVLRGDDPSYFVQQDAATALGRTRDPRAVGVLREMLASRDSWLDVVRAGCVSGLGETRDASVYDDVKSQAEPGRSLNVRLAAIAAMARLGQNRPLASQVVADLDRLSEDRDFRVVMALLGAAETLADATALPMVDRFWRQGPDGRIKRRAEEVSRVLRAGRDQKEQVDRLQNEVEKLKEETRTLRDRVTAVEGGGGK